MLHRLFRMQSSATVSSLTGKKSHHPDTGASLEAEWWRNPPANAGDLGLISWSGRAPGEGSGDPLQDSCLGNPTGMELCRLQSTGSQSVRHNLVLIEHARAWTVLDHFLERVNIIESNKEPEHAPSVSYVGEIAACPSSPFDDDPSTLQSPPALPPPVTISSCSFTWCQPLYTSYRTVQLYFSRYCTIILKTFPLFFVYVFYGLFLWKSL